MANDWSYKFFTLIFICDITTFHKCIDPQHSNGSVLITRTGKREAEGQEEEEKGVIKAEPDAGGP